MVYFKNLLNQKFGHLTVLEHIGIHKNGNYLWKCKCDCGNEITKTSYSLTGGGKFCKTGCIKRRNNLLNKTYGKLTVIDYAKNGTWKCLCGCGNITYANSSMLNSNGKKSCGCLIRKHYCNDLPKSYLNKIRQNAKLKNIPFNLTMEYLWKLFIKQNKKCVLTGKELTISNMSKVSQNKKYGTASLDRIDNSINTGYIEGNVQWVHKDINIIKHTKSKEELLNITIKILNYQGYEICKKNGQKKK